MSEFEACAACLRRTDLLTGLFGFIDIEWRRRTSPRSVLALPDGDLLALDRSGEAEARYECFEAAGAGQAVEAAGMSAACRCSPLYPEALRELEDPPAVMHWLGDLDPVRDEATSAVALVGARKVTRYGEQVGHDLARALAASGLSVVSGMAMGVDSACHAGALDGGGHTVAVLAGGADVPYPPSKHHLHRRILGEGGAIVSEWPPGARAFRWSFVARNRIIAGLAAATVVVEGTIRSGSLTTAGFAAEAGRIVGAVPGPITSQLSSGPNELLADGAVVVTGAAAVLEAVLGPGAGEVADPRDRLAEPLAALLADVEVVATAGATPAGLVRPDRSVADVMRGLTELEIAGFVRRGFDGRYVRTL